jgi:acyl CoA:acetate/3-ketoacid CoA transferase beta subunit
MALDKNGIAKRIAQELQNGWYVNLGIGIPTLVANYVPDGLDVEFQSMPENKQSRLKRERYFLIQQLRLP